MSELQDNIDAAAIRTALGAVEAANKAANIKPTSFRFATMDEWNSFMDSFGGLDYPCHVCEPFESNMLWLNGRIKTSMPMSGWFLMPYRGEINELRSRKVEQDYFIPLRKIAKDYFRHLLDSVIINQEDDQITVNLVPEYGFLSRKLLGISYTVRLPIIEQVY